MKNINKEEALQRLASIEKETEELKKIINQKSDWTSIVDFESACKYLDLDSSKLLTRWSNADLTDAQIAGLKIETCIEAVNTTDGERWIPNFNNSNQYKYYNWFEKKASGWWVGGVFGLRFDGSDVGFAFYYESKKKAEHGAKYFKDYYNIWLGN